MNHNLKDNRLWAVFLEARNGDKRTQWMLFPPRDSTLGATGPAPEGQGRVIKRAMVYKGHKAKWDTIRKPSQGLMAHELKSQLDQYEASGWVLLQPVLIALDEDDYQKVWERENDVSTPYKALRHVEAVTKKRGYRLTGE